MHHRHRSGPEALCGVAYDWRLEVGNAVLQPGHRQQPGSARRFTHIAVVRSGTSLQFYSDGRHDATLSQVMDMNPFRNGAATLRIGGQGRGGRNRFVNGIIDEPAIHDRALTAAEIRTAMQRTGQQMARFAPGPLFD